MNVFCEKALLTSAVSRASKGAASKSSIPALEGIYVSARDNLSLVGYNLDTGIRCMIPADIREKGSIVIPAKLFGDIVRRLPDTSVNIRTEENTVFIECGVAKFQIQGLPADDFPELPLVEPQYKFDLTEAKLADMITRTLFAVSTNEGRPILTGSLFEVTEGTLSVVSVDGQRMAIRREKTENYKGENFSFVVPAPALIEVRNLCGDTDSKVSVTTDNNHAMFELGDTFLITRKLEGEFFNYKQALIWKNNITLKVDVKALTASIDRVGLILHENIRNPLRCIVKENMIALSSVTALGNASDECAVEGNGENLHIGFNHRFMLDALKAVPTEKAVFKMGSPSSPCIMTPPDEPEGEESYLFMVLPVRMAENWE